MNFGAMSMLMLINVFIGSLLVATLFGGNRGRLFDEGDIGTRFVWMARVVDRFHPSFVLACVFSLFSGLSIVGLSAIILMVASGYLLKKTGVLAKCNCYGGLVSAEGKYKDAIGFAIFFGAAFSLLATVLCHAAGSACGPFPGGLLFVLCLFIGGSTVNFWPAVGPLSAGGDSDSHDDARGPDSVARATFFPEVLVGAFEDGEEIKFGQIAASCPMTLFIGLSVDCTACSLLKPVFFRIAETFNQNLRTVFLVDGPGFQEMAGPDAIVLRASKDFLVRAGVTKYPFGTVVDSGSLQKLGVVEYGEDIGSLIVRTLGVAVRPGRAAGNM